VKKQRRKKKKRKRLTRRRNTQPSPAPGKTIDRSIASGDGRPTSRRHGGELLGGGGQRLEVAPDDGVHEHAGVLGGVARRHVHHVGLHDDGGGVGRGGGRVDGGHREVVLEPVLAAHDAEAEDVALVVQDLEALAAGRRGEARHDAHLAERAHAAVARQQRATPHEPLVRLRLVEPPHHGPHRRGRRRHVLDHRGAAPPGPRRRVLVVARRLRGQLAVVRPAPHPRAVRRRRRDRRGHLRRAPDAGQDPAVVLVRHAAGAGRLDARHLALAAGWLVVLGALRS
jgi:hypothetical protein